MLPNYIKVTGFKSYIEDYIDFTSFSPLFCVIGNNGVGKSSIIDMITTALFYQNEATDSRGTGMDDLINSNFDKFEIEYSFVMNDINYKIIRRKIRNGAHELEFYINNENQTEKITETQAKIYNVIKMDYNTFLDTVCIGQGQSGRFMKKKPNERKDVFVQVLGLDKYELLEKRARELKKEINNKIENNEVVLNNFINQTKDKQIYEDLINNNNLKINQYKDIIKLKEEELEQIVVEKAQYEQIKKQSDHILNQRLLLQSKINAIKNNIVNYNDKKMKLENEIIDKKNIEEEIKNLENIINDEQNEYTKVSNEVSSLSAVNNIMINNAKQLKNKYEQLQNYNNAQCDFCGHDITIEYKEKYLKELMSEGKKQLSDINKNKGAIDDLSLEMKKLQSSLIMSRKELQSKQQKINSILQSENQLLIIDSQLKEFNLSLTEYEKEYSDNLNIKLDDIKEKTFNDVNLKYEINNLRLSLSDLESKVAVAIKKLEEIKNAENEIGLLNNEIEELKINLSDYDSLIVAYGKSGIQADIIGNALPEIEEEINELLELLCNGSVNVEFRTQKDKKSKSKAKSVASIETLDIIINDKNGSRTYETYSGGERFRVDFACHVGLAKFLAKRAGATIDFFMIDEGLGSQDQNSKNQFITSVKQLTKIFKQIMVITHIEEMKEAFNNKVLIEKDPINGSKVLVI